MVADCRDDLAQGWTEESRLDALRACAILDTPAESEFDELVEAACEICNAPIGVVNFVDAQRQWFKAVRGLDLGETPRDVSICTHAILGCDVMVVPDTFEDERFFDNPLLIGEPQLRFYAGALLKTREGLPLGTVCVLDHKPRPEGLSRGQERALKALAQAAMRLVEMRMASDRIRASEARFREIADKMPQMIWSADARGRLDYVNRRVEESLGQPAGVLIKDAWLAALHPEDFEPTAQAWRRSLETESLYEIEHRIYHAGIGYRWVLSRALPERDPSGTIHAWFGASTDIHEGKLAKLALSESEARYKALTEAGAAVVWRACPDGKIVDSTGWTELTGQPLSEALGDGWLDRVHPEDRERVVARVRAASNVAVPRTNEYRLRHRDGEYRWMFTRGVPLLNPDGSVREWVGTASDIHDRKSADQRLRESEERYRALVEASTAMVWSAGPEGEFPKVAYSSTIAEYEFDPEGWRTIIHPDDIAHAAEAWQKALASGEPLDVVERKLTKQGDYCWTHVRANPIRNADGSIREWIGAVTDIHERVMSRKALVENEERYRLAARATTDAIWDLDLVTCAMIWGEALETLFGYTPDGRTTSVEWWRDRIHPQDRARVARLLEHLISSGDGRAECEYRVIKADGGEATVFDRFFVQRDDSGKATRIVGAIQDITERRRAQAALEAGEERLRLALQAGRMVAWERSLDSNFVTRSENSWSLLGLGSSDTEEFRRRIHPEDRAKVEGLLDGFEIGQSETIEVRYLTPDQRQIWLGIRAEKTAVNKAIGITFDITDRKLAEGEIWQTANHDALTGLPNRALFQLRFDALLDEARGDGSRLALMLVDLDEFKDVNDMLGHGAGDELLREAGRRLQELAGARAEVARIGGDEFALILSHVDDERDALGFAERIVVAMRASYAFDGRSLSTRASIGLALFPDHHQDQAELMKDADMALYQAKAEGRSRVSLYHPAIRERMEARIRVGQEVRDALEKGEFQPFYQPKICFRTGAIVGFEALARWAHPQKGLLTPAYFGAAFEDAEIAVAIGCAMQERIARDMAAWQEAGIACGRVAINFATAEFADPGLAEAVLARFAAQGQAGARLEVEVTETVLLGSGTENVARILRAFDAAGVTIALDDFGTGYASLTHLKQFPVHHIKIDRSFVRDLVTDADDAAIVAAVISLGRSLGMVVTAEGVETDEQVQRLRLMGCDRAQGFRFAKPIAASRIPWLMRNWNPSTMLAAGPAEAPPAARAGLAR